MSKIGELSEYTYKNVPLKDITDKQDILPKYGFGVRHIQTALVLLCLTVAFITRSHIGVTIVAMTANNTEGRQHFNKTMTIANNKIYSNDTDSIKENNFNKIESNNIYVDVTTSLTVENNVITFDWSKSTQEMVLGSFYLGYGLAVLPIGLIGQQWGGKVLLQILLFIDGVVSTATPWLIYWGDWKAACFCRLMHGLNQAGIYPCVQTLLAKWSPVSERGMLSSIVYTGTPIGSVIGFQLGGFLADSKWGWPSTYMTVGAINLISFILFTFFASETPREHSTIKEKEKKYILGATNAVTLKIPNVPWEAIITSKPMWGTTATHIGSCVAFIFIFTEVPTYIYYILGKDVKSSGILTSVPYICSIFCSILFGWISDYVTNNNIVSIKNARRISNTISQCVLAVALICTSYTNNVTVAMICLVISMCADMATHTGWKVNHIDLAPNFSGFLMTFGNTFMNIFTTLLPVVVSYVVVDVTDVIQWRIMFYIIAGICLITNAIFVLMMSADTQPWNYIVDDNTFIQQTKDEETKAKNDDGKVHDNKVLN